MREKNYEVDLTKLIDRYAFAEIRAFKIAIAIAIPVFILLVILVS